MAVLDTELIEQLHEQLCATPVGKFYKRVNCVYLWAKGKDKAEICETYGVSLVSLNRWIRLVSANGVESLHSIKQSGRPSLLSLEQVIELDRVLSLSPLECGYKQPIWEGKLVADYVRREFKIELSVRTAQWRIKWLEYTLQRPRVMPAEADEEQRAIFLRNTATLSKGEM